MFDVSGPIICRSDRDSNLYSQVNEIVDEGTWKCFKGKGVIWSGGLATCVGILVYDRADRIACLGHLNEFIDLANPRPNGELDQFISFVRRKMTNLASAKVVVGGGMRMFGDEFEVNRTSIISALHEAGVADRNLVVQWALNRGGVDIIIDVQSGRTEILIDEE